MARPPGQGIECACGRTHRLTPTALQIALQAFIAGDAQRVQSGVVVPMCVFELLDAYEHDRRKDRVIVT
jgi:hypothetical protein